MKLLKNFLTIAFVSILIHSCKKDSTVQIATSYRYFPVEKGRFVIYDVDSVYHADNDNNTDDSVYRYHFEMKDLVGDLFMDGQGRQNRIVRRFTRANDTLEWTEVAACSQLLTSSAAYQTEDNVPYHKLAFPVNGTVTWNGNDENMLTEEMYQYESFHVASSVNGFSFDSTLSVLQRDDDNFIERIYGKEIYANNVGLIFRERDDLHKINGMVVKGTEFRLQVKGYGIE